MLWFIITHLFGALLNWLSLARLSSDEKDLEITILRLQVNILRRKLGKAPRVTRIEKLTLAGLTARLKSMTQRTYHELREVVLVSSPETIMKMAS